MRHLSLCGFAVLITAITAPLSARADLSNAAFGTYEYSSKTKERGKVIARSSGTLTIFPDDAGGVELTTRDRHTSPTGRSSIAAHLYSDGRYTITVFNHDTRRSTLRTGEWHLINATAIVAFSRKAGVSISYKERFGSILSGIGLSTLNLRKGVQQHLLVRK